MASPMLQYINNERAARNQRRRDQVTGNNLLLIFLVVVAIVQMFVWFRAGDSYSLGKAAGVTLLAHCAGFTALFAFIAFAISRRPEEDPLKNFFLRVFDHIGA